MQKAEVVSLGTFLIPFPIMVIYSLAIVYTNLFKACHHVTTCCHALSAKNYMVSL